MFRPATTDDATAIVAIYNPYILQSTVTFEESPITAAEMAQRVSDVQRANLPWLVAEDSGALMGYAYASPWKTRSAYRFSVEISIYLAPTHTGRGLGSRMLEQLLAELRHRGLHTAIGGAALPNPASVALMEKFGFAPVALLREVGCKFGRRIDVGYWQLML